MSNIDEPVTPEAVTPVDAIPEATPQQTAPELPTAAEAKPKRPGIDFAFDLLIGFTVLVLLALPGALLAHFIHNTGILLAVFGMVFFFASALRARSGGDPVLQGFGLALGAGLPFLLAAAISSRTALPQVAALVLLLAFLCICGAFARLFYNAQKLPLAATAVAGAAIIGFCSWTYGIQHLIPGLAFKKMDQPSPAFTLTRLDGTPVSLDSLKGKVVVLDFWATWCEPCQAEMPTLLTVYNQFQKDPNVVYIAVATGWDDDTDDKVRAFITKKHFPFPVAFDPAHAAQNFKIATIPTQIILDRNGHIRMINTGYNDDDDALKTRLTTTIQGLLRQ